MLRSILKIILIFLIFYTPVFSKNYNKILINGNNRISNDTILVFADIPPKEFLDEISLNTILKNIYNSNFFKDVNIKIFNEDLIIEVTEYPLIQNLFIEGINAKKIKKKVEDVLLLKARSPFNTYDLKRDVMIVQNVLKDMGYYFSSVTTTMVKLNDNKIDLSYNISLGDKAKISRISFIGDKVFKDRVLRNIIVSEEYKFWKFVSGGKFLNENLINYDQRLLKNYYKNNGYYNVIIESSFASYLGNDEFEIIYNISAGEKFFFNNLKVKLPIDYNPSNFEKLNLIFDNLKGKKYALNSIEVILDEIDKIVLIDEFEFLNASVTEQINDNLIDLTFNIEETEKLYIEKINIYGNNITREDVIRNNLYVDEGDGFNDLLNKKSINNIKSLNIFSKVNTEILAGSSDNKKIINISVEEKATGEISAGAGIGSDGASIAFGVKENNFLGRGIEFGSDLRLSQKSVKGLVSLNNPNYNSTNRSFNLSLESTIIDRLKNFGYKSNKTGFTIGSGFEYYDDFFLNIGVSSYAEKIRTDSSATDAIKKQKGSFFDTFFNYTIDYDKRNQRFKTSDGYRSIFTQNIPLISNNFSLTNTFDYKFYNEWLNENISTLGFYAKATKSLSNKNVKLSERLFVPSSKLRGFEPGKVGPMDGTDYIGTNYLMTFNASTTLPQILPNLENTDFSLFFDAASMWGTDYNTSLAQDNKIRSSLGIGIDVFTPIGPLSFTLTEAISHDSKDVTETFRFNLGTTF